MAESREQESMRLIREICLNKVLKALEAKPDFIRGIFSGEEPGSELSKTLIEATETLREFLYPDSIET
jgi:hypothetical protein